MAWLSFGFECNLTDAGKSHRALELPAHHKCVMKAPTGQTSMPDTNQGCLTHHVYSEWGQTDGQAATGEVIHMGSQKHLPSHWLILGFWTSKALKRYTQRPQTTWDDLEHSLGSIFVVWKFQFFTANSNYLLTLQFTEDYFLLNLSGGRGWRETLLFSNYPSPAPLAVWAAELSTATSYTACFL